MTSEKLALITGVSREMGLGYETAKQLKELGYKVIITAREFEKVKELAEKINVIAMALDITDDQSVEQLAHYIEKQFGKLDVLVNNAGAFFDQDGEPLSADIQFIKEAIDTNLLGAWRMIKSFEPLLRKSENGRIVNVSSGAGSFGDPVFGLANHFSKVPVYGITKLALNGLTVKLARQLKDTKIKINSVDPGFTATYAGTENYGARPVSEGAKSVIWAVTIPDNGPSGGFFRDGETLSW
ncbi:SDR family NAD(P)-dependent oxidoreductase [Dyadobacter arcticus]|uniref:NAD(P)-dependent dehydrogenase (Short-subunit alcohol dehydrogenase family) n=1 Tax=Dyadobacter arcticus TaxID=1078754 RepID=A0ABX0USL6_9BACT|nr:SDR family NAD(P)-dependent oxidoreductase [Dyadobacter arcticus]NIJ54640.1 NAD(P)-dependent dehydrogenase (short-subunit alcohol dehydrogenase family) [Dyadobacter arcticus]